MEIIKNLIIGYIMLYFIIWMHEVGHAFCYWIYGAKKSPLIVSVTPYIFFSTPLPVDLEKEKLMSEHQKFNTAIAGVIVNLVFGFISLLIILLGTSNNLLYISLFYFSTLHFSEAISYLTINNIFLASDMKSIAKFNQNLRIPCFIIGCIALVCLVYLFSKAVYPWKIILIIFNLLAMAGMGVGRVIFTYILHSKK
jgi:hypothetical protein